MNLEQTCAAMTPVLREIDMAFSRFMLRLSGDMPSDAACSLFLAAALTSHLTTGERHICLDLADAGGRSVREVVAADTETDIPELILPAPDIWREHLETAPVVAAPGTVAPLILDDQNRLYLYRYWDAQQTLAHELNRRMQGHDRELPETVKHLLPKLFPHPKETPDRQMIAALAALTRRFTVISGGPGTGKTHTVGAILGLLLAADPDRRIAMAAPTGKAAARLTESVQAVKMALSLDPAVRSRFPEAAQTLHRLLGIRPGDGDTADGLTLAVDAVIVDEASMVSLPLMARLMTALPETAIMILLGDRHQLASVEAGAVLGDIAGEAAVKTFSSAFASLCTRVCDTPFPNDWITTDAPAAADGVVELQYSYRFAHAPGIGAVSRAVNAGDPGAALAAMGGDSQVSREPVLSPGDADLRLTAVYETYFQRLYRADSPETALARFSEFRILCAHHAGTGGERFINRFMTDLARAVASAGPADRFYKGQPLLITANDPVTKLFNGDVGMVWPDENGQLRCWFSDGKGGMREMGLSRLPAHAPAYAMTVHKSQGSEFDTVLFCLPEQISPLCTRELVYTGITRAKNRAILWTDEAVFRAAVLARVERRSGLRDAVILKK